MRYVFFAVLLAGCAPLPQETLQRLDPLVVNPAAIAVTLELPQGYGLSPGSEQLTLMAIRSDTGQQTVETFVLRQRASSDRTLVYAVDRDDVPRFRAQQQQIAAWKSDAPDQTQGQMDLRLWPCRTAEPAAAVPQVSAQLVLDENTQPVPLLTNAPVANLVRELSLPDCANSRSRH